MVPRTPFRAGCWRSAGSRRIAETSPRPPATTRSACGFGTRRGAGSASSPPWPGPGGWRRGSDRMRRPGSSGLPPPWGRARLRGAAPGTDAGRASRLNCLRGPRRAGLCRGVGGGRGAALRGRPGRRRGPPGVAGRTPRADRSRRPGPARRSVAAGGRRRPADRRRAVQPGDRRRPLRQPKHRHQPRPQHPRQARPRLPRRRRRLGCPPRPRLTVVASLALAGSAPPPSPQ